MTIFDPKRHLPAGFDWEPTRDCLIWGHILSGLTIFSFVSRYSYALDNLYAHIQGPDGTLIRTLVTTRTIAPFGELIWGTPLLGAWIFLAVMPLLIWRYYQFHTRDSMSVYTMRRLPDRWEYPRRCWTQPVLSAIAELLLFAILIGLCWLIWRFATPEACLPR